MARRGWLVVVVLMLSTYFFACAAQQSRPAPDQHVTAGGVLMFERPKDFGWAVHPDQLLVRSYIPPCDHSFDYCLYYLGEELAGTNFESAGVRIEGRDDLTSEEACLSTPPRGYLEFEPVLRREDGFSVSLFEPVQDAAMGHYAEGRLFRLAVHSACYELETRIGASRFEFYEEGSIREFSQGQRDAVEARLHEVLSAVRLVDRPDIVLFQPLNGANHHPNHRGDAVAPVP